MNEVIRQLNERKSVRVFTDQPIEEWDMSKVYNVGGMAHYTGAEYKDLVTDTPEILLTATYNFDGLTRIAPAE